MGRSLDRVPRLPALLLDRRLRAGPAASVITCPGAGGKSDLEAVPNPVIHSLQIIDDDPILPIEDSPDLPPLWKVFGAERLQVQNSHVMHLARGKVGPFRVDGSASGAADGSGRIGVQMTMRDEGNEDRAVTAETMVFRLA